jgi:DNA-binding transcriptional MerR regulator
MYKIGDFARISQVSVKTLHHYDEIGILKPGYIDPSTGYRHYSIDQLPRLNRILILKDLGFSLEQVARILDGNRSDEQLVELLRSKQAELLQYVRESQARLARIDARLRRGGQEDEMVTYDVKIQRVEPMLIASVRDIIPTGTIYELFNELRVYLRQHGIAESSQPFFTLSYYDEYREGFQDMGRPTQMDRSFSCGP